MKKHLFDLTKPQDIEEIKKILIQTIVENYGLTELEARRFENYYQKGVHPDLAIEIILLDRKSNREVQP
jgi:hypothetical protein